MAKQYFTNKCRRGCVKYCFFFWHKKIKFISSSCRVMFILLYTSRQKGMDKIKIYKFQREIAEITSWINSPVRLCKINNLGPRHSFYEFNKWYTFHWKNTHVYIIKNYCISLYNDAWTLYFLQLSFQDVTKVIETSYRRFCRDTDCQNNGYWILWLVHKCLQ